MTVCDFTEGCRDHDEADDADNELDVVNLSDFSTVMTECDDICKRCQPWFFLLVTLDLS